MRVEIAYSDEDRDYIIQGEVSETGEVHLLDAWGEYDLRGGFDVLDKIEASPRDLEFVQAKLRIASGFYDDPA